MLCMNDRRTLRVSKMKLVDKGETVASNKENIYILDVTYYFLDKQKSNTKSDVSAHEGDKE